MFNWLYKILFKEPKECACSNTNYIKYSTKDDFNIDDFNNWFCKIYSGYGGYPGGAKGIYLRIDKLSTSMIEEYFEYIGYYDSSFEILDIHDLIVNDWHKQLKEIGKKNK